MKNCIIVLVFSLFSCVSAWGGEMIDDPLLTMVLVDQLEFRLGNGDVPVSWNAEGWLGYDINKLWIKTEGKYVNGEGKEVELQALYSRAITPFWDLLIGWRGDVRPHPTRNWLSLGVKGLAPYFFDIEAALFVGDSGRTSARLQAEYDLLFTQRLILTPDIRINLFGKDDQAVSIGSGLSDLEIGLRLRYEIRREFAPYVGINWIHLYGNTADFAAEEGRDTDDFRFVFGVRAWF